MTQAVPNHETETHLLSAVDAAIYDLFPELSDPEAVAASKAQDATSFASRLRNS
jgi:hypothetical protein